MGYCWDKRPSIERIKELSINISNNQKEISKNIIQLEDKNKELEKKLNLMEQEKENILKTYLYS